MSLSPRGSVFQTADCSFRLELEPNHPIPLRSKLRVAAGSRSTDMEKNGRHCRHDYRMKNRAGRGIRATAAAIRSNLTIVRGAFLGRDGGTFTPAV